MTALQKGRGEPRDRPRTADTRPVTDGPTAPRTVQAPEAVRHTWFAECLWIDVDHRTARHDLADVLFGRRPRPSSGTAAGEATRLLAAHPGCLLVLLPLPDGAWLAAARARHSPGRLSNRAPTRRASSALTVVDSDNARR